MAVALFFALSTPKAFAHASIHGDTAGKTEEAVRIFGDSLQIQDPNQPKPGFRQIEMFEIIPPASK